jgi:CIC family chloride channel protein
LEAPRPRLAWHAPGVPGGGVLFAASVLDGGVSATDAAWLLPASLLLTVASYAVGAPGGIFAPLLVIGALLGLVNHGTLAPPALAAPMQVLAAAGMAGIFAASVRAPFTGTVLLVEMSGTLELAMPLLLASLAAHGVARVLGGRPIYAALLERELGRIGTGARPGALAVGEADSGTSAGAK